MTTYFIQIKFIQNSTLGLNVFVLHNRNFVYNFRDIKNIKTALWNIFNLTIYSFVVLYNYSKVRNVVFGLTM